MRQKSMNGTCKIKMYDTGMVRLLAVSSGMAAKGTETAEAWKMVRIYKNFNSQYKLACEQWELDIC